MNLVQIIQMKSKLEARAALQKLTAGRKGSRKKGAEARKTKGGKWKTKTWEGRNTCYDYFNHQKQTPIVSTISLPPPLCNIVE